MPSKMKSIEPYVSHSISSSMMSSLNPSKVSSLIISVSGSVIPSHSVEPNMSSSSSPYDIPLLSSRYCHVLKGDIGEWPSYMPSKMQPRDTAVYHSTSLPIMSSLNPSKVPYLFPSVAHLYSPSQIYSSLPKFLSAAHAGMPSQIY